MSAIRLLERRNAGAAGVRLSAALTRLGPSWVKFGQFLATRPDIVGKQLARDLESLQDKMAPFGMDEARAVIADALGAPVEALFAEFGPPVAAASIAQVHRASVVREDGSRRDVAVKVLRPGIERHFKRDLGDFFFIARLAEQLSAEGERLRLVAAVETLARSVTLEMDFRLEAAAASEMAENTKDDHDFRVPEVDWDRTARAVLTLEWIDGIKLSDRDALIAAGRDVAAVSCALMQSFLRHAMRDGFFHGDMHPGNLFVDDQGRIVAVDFGIMGRLGDTERRFLAEVLHGFIVRNYRRVAEVHFEVGYVPDIHPVESFTQAIRAIGEPIHGRSNDQISMAKLLTLMFEITSLFGMRARPELLLLQKSMVVVEGVARALDPKFDMWTAAAPVVREWIARNLGPIGRAEDVTDGAVGVGRFIGAVPELLGRSAVLVRRVDELTRAGFVLAPETVEAIGRAEGRGNRQIAAAAWIIAALLAALLVKLW
ncbi:putative ubiquinone biosynthesis protein UbiB [Blastochloris viridis]|uniref:Putative ubiquinone biosynthesis protein UbiB n=1 Tax=Blastochloris viridis TaxID=1079 RepID=A0A0S4Q4Z8_BLAVI|nr:putative ubiquinone biosynthesis protein UbiB [Blastochloris viridis]